MDLTKRILFTLFIFGVYQIGLHISGPGIDMINTIMSYGSGDDVLAMLRHHSGVPYGPFAMSSIYSIFSLGLWSYISSHVFLWLLKMIIPSLRKVTRGKTDYIAKYITLFICIFQSIALLSLFQAQFLYDQNLPYYA